MEPQLPETFGISYQILFTIKVLHRYFLDYGATGFDTKTASPETKKRLDLIRQGYDVGQFWEILPDAETRQLLQNQRMLFKKQPDGFAVLVATEKPGSLKPLLPLSTGLKLVFAVYPNDSTFLLYTNLATEVMDDLKKNTRIFRLKNRNSTADPQKNSLNTGETIKPGDVENRPAGSSAGGRIQPPMGFIEIEHAPTKRTLLTEEKEIQPSLTYTVVLQNRTTQWRYKTDSLGEFKLVQNGFIATSGDPPTLPNPTPSTTSIDADGHFFSMIY